MSVIPRICGAFLVVLIANLTAQGRLPDGPDKANSDLALVPGNENEFISLRVADLVSSDLGKKLFPAADFKDTTDKTGLTLADVERITAVLGAQDAINLFPEMVVILTGNPLFAGRRIPPRFYAIVRLSKPAEPKKILEHFFVEARASEYNGKQFSSAGFLVGELAIYFHDDRTLVVGTPAGIKKAIDQAIKPKTDGPLQPLLAQVGKEQVTYGFIPTADLVAPPVGALFQLGLGDLKTGLARGTLKGKELALDVTATFPDKNKASASLKQLERMLPQTKEIAQRFMEHAPPEVRKAATKFLENVRMSQDAATVTVSTKTEVPANLLNRP
jgi:hypothetical protein